MPLQTFIRYSLTSCCTLALVACLSACVTQHPAPDTIAVAAAASAAASAATAAAAAAASAAAAAAAAPQPDPGDVASRQLLAYHEQMRQLSPADLASDIARLGALVAANAAAVPPGTVLELALALSQQHNGGDVARAVALLEPLTKSSASELQPWQPMARLLYGRISEQRRLEDQLERANTQRRDQQRSLQQLSEKLEALKAIERSMTTRPAVVVAPALAPASVPASSPPKTP